MTQVVEHVTVGTGLGDLAPLYADAPDGVRVNMILSADGAVAFHGLVGPLSTHATRTCCWRCAVTPTSSWSGRARCGPNATVRCA